MPCQRTNVKAPFNWPEDGKALVSWPASWPGMMAGLRESVRERADGRCEYCRLPGAVLSPEIMTSLRASLMKEGRW
jgi:hypothetical protein